MNNYIDSINNEKIVHGKLNPEYWNSRNKRKQAINLCAMYE